MAQKLDMSKAYDKVEWSFLEEVMTMMGFGSKVTQLIMFCIKTVTFSVLINREPTKPIIPSMGLRQGDPLSLYLFLLCTEVLIHYWDHQNMLNLKGAQPINHLLFVYDSIMYCKAEVGETTRLQSLLKQYEEASGQKKNK